MFNSNNVKKIQKRSSLESGQAIIEYVLVLVMTIGLVLLFSFAFVRPVKDFLNSYLGDYTKCLLQTGELPKLGDEDQSSEGQCSSYLNASRKNLQDAAKNNSNGNLGLNGGGKNGNGNGNGNGDGSAQGGDSADGSKDSNRGGKNKAANALRMRTTFGPSPTGVGENNAPNTIELGKISEGTNGKNSFFKGGSFGQNIIYIQRQSNFAVKWDQISEKDKKKLKKKEGKYQVLTKNEGVSSETKKKFIVNPPKAKEVVEVEKSSFSFSGLFKWFIIIIIILAIIIFVGSQIMQISNSWEK